MKNLMSNKKYLEQFAFAFLLFTFSFSVVSAQPAPSAPRSGIIPAVKEKKLANGLTVAVVERKDVPLVTVQLLIKSGASAEDPEKAGLADMTASMLTKGTKTRTATQIAEQMEFLGGSINTGAGWNNSVVTLTVTSDKLDKAMAIMADVVLNPTFDQKELDLLKSQALDGLTYNLTQPGFLGSFVASKYSFDEHPASGTPESLKGISRSDILEFHKDNFGAEYAVLIFAGNVSSLRANALAKKHLARLKGQPLMEAPEMEPKTGANSFQESAESAQKQTQMAAQLPILKRILIVDLPNSGQAAVTYAKKIKKDGRIVWDEEKNRGLTSTVFYPASVMNSILGGGYSSRLNQEIRIKRGLSYGAGSSFGWRLYNATFSTSTQTKNESAAEVAELVLAELKRLAGSSATESEISSRKSVLIGTFGRNLETTGGLAAAVSDLYSFELPATDLSSYTKSVSEVSSSQIREIASQNLTDGDIIIVGDYAIFKDDLAKRFPNIKVDVIRSAELDISKENLRR